MLLISIILGTLILMGREKVAQGNLNVSKRIKTHTAAGQSVQIQDSSKEEVL
jgi:hypothetical protein